MKLSRLLLSLCLILAIIVQSAHADRRRLNRFSDLVVTGSVTLENNEYLRGKEVGGVAVNMIGFGATDDLIIGVNGGAYDDVQIYAPDEIQQIIGGSTVARFDSDGLIFTQSTNRIQGNTSDGADSYLFTLSSGGAYASDGSRGAGALFGGNENGSLPGIARIVGGSSGEIQMYVGSEVATFDSGGLDPGADNTFDLGTSSLEWRDIHVDRIGYIDTLSSIDATIIGNFNAGNASSFEIANGTDLPDSPVAGSCYLDTNDGACDDANDSGGTSVCCYDGAAWVLLGNTGS